MNLNFMAIWLMLFMASSTFSSAAGPVPKKPGMFPNVNFPDKKDENIPGEIIGTDGSNKKESPNSKEVRELFEGFSLGSPLALNFAHEGQPNARYKPHREMDEALVGETGKRKR